MLKICITTIAIETSVSVYEHNRYLEAAKKLIITNLIHTTYDIVLLTNKPEFFSGFTTPRLIVIDYDENFNESTISGKKFNMHTKRHSIYIAQKLGYDIIYYNDCDCFITGWDDLSFEERCMDDCDVTFTKPPTPQLKGLRTTYKSFQEIIDNEFGDLYQPEFDNAPNPAETRIIFKNNNKLTAFLSFWDKISERNNNYFTYHDGIYIGTSVIYAKMKSCGTVRTDNFIKYCRIQHGKNILNYFGNKHK